MLSWLFLILILFLLLIPFILTIKNISEIFSRKKELSKRTKRIRLISDMAIMVLGTILTIVLFSYVNNFKDWYTQLTIYVPIPEVEDGIYDSSLALHSTSYMGYSFYTYISYCKCSFICNIKTI